MKGYLLALFAVCLIQHATADCSIYDNSVCSGLTGGVFIPSVHTCQGWVQCHENAVFNCGNCPDGQYFDGNRGGCFYSNLVDCAIQPEAGMCTPDLIHRVPRPDSCSVYYQCLGQGEPIEHSCADNLHFNEVTEQCDFIENVRCLREPIVVECPATTEPFTQEPHPWLCNRFFVCINGVGTERECLEGMLFDVNLRQCQLEDRAVCVESSVVASAAKAVTAQETVRDDVDLIYECSEEPFYYKMAHPSNCQKYIQCIYGVPNLQTCTEGTLFDPEHLRCDFAENVTCAGV